MRNNQAVKLFVVLFLCATFVFGFSHFGAIAFQSLTAENEGFQAGTMIGGVDVSGKSKTEALSILTERLSKWRSETTINLQYKEKIVPVDVSIIEFDLEGSVSKIIEGRDNPVIVDVKSGDLYQAVKSASEDLTKSTIEMDSVQTELLTFAKNLSRGNFHIKLERYLIDQNNQAVVLNTTTIKSENTPLDLGMMVEELSPIKIEPEAQFSLLKLLEEHNLTSLGTEGASMIASSLYQTILPSNFKIIEKHIGQILPDYVNLGLEAKVDFKNHLDFAFVNPNDTSYEIELRLENGALISSLKGSSFLYDYKIAFSEKQVFEPKTVVQFSPVLAPTAKRLQQKGLNGQLIKVYREIFNDQNTWLGKELISEDFYPPIPRIEVHGLAVPPKTDDGTGGQNGTGTGDSTQGNNPPGSTPNIPQTPTNPNVPDEGDDGGLFGKPNEELK